MRPVTLILASDEFVASEALAEVRAQAIGEGLVAEALSPEEPQAILYALDTPALFGEGRLVIVHDAQTLPAETQDAIAERAEQGLEGVALALVASGATAQKLAKRLPASAVIRAEGVPPWKAAEWTVARAKTKGRRMTGEAAAALVESVGVELRDLAAAVDRLIETTPADPIGADRVAEQFHGVESRVYQFVDAVFDRDVALARKRLSALLEQGENPIGLLASVHRQLRVVAAVASGDGRSTATLAKDLGLKTEGPVKRAQRQARGFTPAKIARAYRLIADADLALKSEEDDPLVLELLVDEIASR